MTAAGTAGSLVALGPAPLRPWALPRGPLALFWGLRALFRRLRALVLLMLLVPVLVTGLAGCGKPEPMRVGFVAELSDASADVARSARNGALMALEPWAGASAPHGRPVEMVVRDLGRTEADVAQAMADMAAARVVAVVGPLTSGGVARALPEAQKHGILLVSPTATSLDFFGKDDHLFRINGTTRDNGLAYARHCIDKRALRRVAVAVTTHNSVFAENWLAQFSAAYQAAGGQVARVVRFDASGTALADAARNLLQAPAPDGLVIVGNAVDTARLTQQLRKIDAQRPILVAEWAATEELIQLGGQAVEGVEMVQLYDRTDTSPGWVAFRDTYERRFKEAPGYASVAGYDAATVLMSALSRSSPDLALKDALRRFGPFQGLQQSIRFDVNGDTSRRAFFVVVRGGRFQPAD